MLTKIFIETVKKAKQAKEFIPAYLILIVHSV